MRYIALIICILQIWVMNLLRRFDSGWSHLADTFVYYFSMIYILYLFWDIISLVYVHVKSFVVDILSVSIEILDAIKPRVQKREILPVRRQMARPRQKPRITYTRLG